MKDAKKFSSAWARLEAFSANLPRLIDIECVEQYHTILTDLENSLEEVLEEFKIHLSRMKPRITGGQMGINGGQGRTFYSKEVYCDLNYFRSQIEGLKRYIGKAQESGERQPSPKSERPHTGLYVENMYGSNIQHGSPGAVASASYQTNYQTNDAQIQELVRQLKDLLSSRELSSDLSDEVAADLATVEAQITHPRPKTAIINESFKSIRSVLESAAGSIAAPAIVQGISRLLGLS